MFAYLTLTPRQAEDNIPESASMGCLRWQRLLLSFSPARSRDSESALLSTRDDDTVRSVRLAKTGSHALSL